MRRTPETGTKENLKCQIAIISLSSQFRPSVPWQTHHEAQVLRRIKICSLKRKIHLLKYEFINFPKLFAARNRLLHRTMYGVFPFKAYSITLLVKPFL